MDAIVSKIKSTKENTPLFIQVVMSNPKQTVPSSASLKLLIQASSKTREKSFKPFKEALVFPTYYGMAKMEILTF